MIGKISLAILLCAVISASVFGQRCDSIGAASSGGWKPVSTAPRDGTTVEMLETYGVAPWYGLFKWTGDHDATGPDGKIIHFKGAPRWVSVNELGKGVSEDSCLFWRPYKSSGKYTDPTGGAQQTVAYWCAHMGMRYNKKKDACE